MSDPSGPDATPSGADATSEDVLDEARQQLDEARRRLAEAPVATVLTNHVMGMYELAAIHLSSRPADLGQASLAIDAVACLVEGLGDRLDEADTMRDALANIRMAFVQVAGAQGAAPGTSMPPGDAVERDGAATGVAGNGDRAASDDDDPAG